ncbi:hypothetical protein HYH02_003129 [Chlamydomonas schloesseri]|uniref:Uncharacterized protein n=1 Tax=Chlamydomonas schloesseri TaxID=2026947 RepID=A0A836BAH4_9CHLO|nr:hypothetical protein HYH02_003129 [Chlamydomonas schloesseri]|eukprot:KAG2452094.1 hypothetical protein HYH02_003129 [Chlamydomonas schloesseri]
MEYLEKEKLFAKADAIRPGLGAALSRMPLHSAAEFKEIDDMLEEHRKGSELRAAASRDLQRQTEEYRRLTAQLDAKLATAGLSALPPAATAAARHLAAVAGGLGLATTAEGAMLAAWVAADARRQEAERLKAKRELAASDLRAAAEAAGRQAEEVARALDGAAARQAEGLRALPRGQVERRQVEEKAASYVAKIQKATRQLQDTGFREELGHEALTELAAKVTAAEGQLAAVREELKEYDNIPPSEAGLASQMETLQRELGQVNQALGGAFVGNTGGGGHGGHGHAHTLLRHGRSGAMGFGQ